MERSQISDLINGQEPPMELECSGFFALQFYEQGKLTDLANCTYLMLGDTWYRIFFEASVAFWRQDASPATPTNSDFDHGLLLNDLNDCAVVVGHTLISADYHETHNGVLAHLQFSSGYMIVLEYDRAADSTKISLVS